MTSRRRIAATAAVAMLVTACGSEAVPINSSAVPEATRPACEELIDALPDTLRHQLRRPVHPPDALGAAWGDPPVVLTCGGAMPAEFDRYSPCDVADGVGWFIPDSLREDPTADVTMTTIGRRPIVAVTIPAALRPEGVPAVMSELAGSLRRHTRLLHRCV